MLNLPPLAFVMFSSCNSQSMELFVRSPNLTVTLLSPLQSALAMAVIYGGDSVRPLSLTNNVEAVQEKEMG